MTTVLSYNIVLFLTSQTRIWTLKKKKPKQNKEAMFQEVFKLLK